MGRREGWEVLIAVGRETGFQSRTWQGPLDIEWLGGRVRKGRTAEPVPWTPDRRKVAVQGQYCRGISTGGSLSEKRECLAGRG